MCYNKGMDAQILKSINMTAEPGHTSCASSQVTRSAVTIYREDAKMETKREELIETIREIEVEHNVYVDIDTMSYTNGEREDVYGWMPIPEEWINEAV